MISTTISLIAGLIISIGLMLVGAVTVCRKLLEFGEQSARKVSDKPSGKVD